LAKWSKGPWIQFPAARTVVDINDKTINPSNYAKYEKDEIVYIKESYYYDHIDHLGYLPKEKPDWFNSEYMYYRIDGDCCHQIPECCCAEVGKPKWTNKMFMAEWISRTKIQIINVRVEKFNQISKADAIAEGFNSIQEFFDCIEKIHKPKDIIEFLKNYCFAYDFKVVKK